jgi:hypothetical protein
VHEERAPRRASTFVRAIVQIIDCSMCIYAYMSGDEVGTHSHFSNDDGPVTCSPPRLSRFVLYQHQQLQQLCCCFTTNTVYLFGNTLKAHSDCARQRRARKPLPAARQRAWTRLKIEQSSLFPALTRANARSLNEPSSF